MELDEKSKVSTRCARVHPVTRESLSDRKPLVNLNVFT